ncbi:hypothetical protein F9C11_20955 [Amycolatopsis sp. VS8301801F10]|uniref:hypothetical protein n=1 Tax=Amycolatopsis sp. VS8301801F10 TaxID=2652442 RepID=UPI0038FC74E0
MSAVTRTNHSPLPEWCTARASARTGQAAQQYQQDEDQTHARLKQLGKPLDDLMLGKPILRGGVRVGEPMPRRGVAIGEPELPGQER